MKRILTILILFAFPYLSHAQTFSWATPFSFDDYNIGNSIKVDGAGNSYVCGNYYNTGGAGPQTGTSGAFIAKFNTSGTLVWSDTVKNSDAGGCRLDVDGSGNVYFATYVTGSHMVGGTTVTSAGLKDIVIAKYNSTGVLQWVKSEGGTDNDAAQGIVVDGTGNVYVAGYFGDMAIFSGAMEMPVGYSDIFIAKYSSAGTLAWVQVASGDGDTTSGVGHDQAMDLSLDNTGNLVLAGYFTGEVVFGTTTLTSTGVGAGFIAKADPQGNWVWAKNTGTAPTGIDMDSNGNGYISGGFANAVTIGATTLTSAGDIDIYLAKFNSAGDIAWVKQAGGADEDRGYDVAVDNLGNPHLTGAFMGDISIGDTNLIVAGEENSFIAKYDASGNFVWAKQVTANTGAWEFVNAHAIDMDAAGDAYITGSFFAAAMFDSFSFTSGNPADAFVAKLSTAVTTTVEEDTLLNNFSVYHKGNNVINLLYETITDLSVQVMSVTGQCIYSENNINLRGKGSKNIQLPATAKGIYFVNIVSGTTHKAAKILVN
ncbi:MAG: T9SS type A sorting domain-containing protein [Bacteroidota bacterium]